MRSLNRSANVSGHTSAAEKPALDWRLKLGTGLFVLSIVLPLVGVPLVTALGLSAARTASVSGVLLVGAEVLGLCGVAVMGKDGYAYIKNRVLGFLKRHGPPKQVSRLRYTIGLVMFSLPLLFGWLSIYIPKLVTGIARDPFVFAIGGDFLLLTSLFVLGGNFWDKLRSLFVYDAEVHFAPR